MKSKPWYTSKTLQGQLVALIGLVVEWAHLPILQDEVSSLVSVVFILCGTVFGIYGRIVTKGEKISK